MKKLMLSMVTVVLLASCGGGDKKEKGEEKGEYKPKEVTWENLKGKWEIVEHEDLLTNKSLAGKTIEIVQDSIFYYDKDGTPVRRKLELHAQYGPRIEVIKVAEDSSRTTLTGPVQLYFHEMEPDKAFLTEGDQTIIMKQMK